MAGVALLEAPALGVLVTGGALVAPVAVPATDPLIERAPTATSSEKVPRSPGEIGTRFSAAGPRPPCGKAGAQRKPHTAIDPTVARAATPRLGVLSPAHDQRRVTNCLKVRTSM